MSTDLPAARVPYPSAPLRLVAFEVQFGFAPSLATSDGRAGIYERLREVYPIADAQMTFQVAVGPLGAAPSEGSDLVMINAGRTRSVTVGPSALTLQTTTFIDSSELVEAITAALEAVDPIGIAEIRRVGLRFVDEVRISAVGGAGDWEPYIAGDLLGSIRFAGDYAVEGCESQLVLRVDEAVRAVVRYGPRNGFAVDPQGRLRLPAIEPGHFFLLDIDTFWQPPEGALVSFTVPGIIDTYWRLDQPSHVLFERAIRSRAREIFHKERA